MILFVFIIRENIIYLFIILFSHYLFKKCIYTIFHCFCCVHWWFGIGVCTLKLSRYKCVCTFVSKWHVHTLFSLYLYVYKNEVSHLRNEVAHLKQLLLAHKDCPVTNLQKKAAYLGKWSLSCGSFTCICMIWSPFHFFFLSLRRGTHERDVWAHGLPGTGHSAQLSGPQPLVYSRAQWPELPCCGWGGGHVGAGRDGQPAGGERWAIACHHGHTVPPVQQMMRAANSLPGTLRIPGDGGRSVHI